MVDREINRLQRLLQSHLIILDDGAQAMAMAGMPSAEEDPESKNHRKYETDARREYELAKADLLASQRRGTTGVADPVPAAATSPVATPRDMDPDRNFEPEPEPAPEPEEPSAEPTPFHSVVLRPAVEPVSLADAVAVLLQTAFVASQLPRGRRQRSRAAIAATVCAQEVEARKALRRKGR